MSRSLLFPIILENQKAKTEINFFKSLKQKSWSEALKENTEYCALNTPWMIGHSNGAEKKIISASHKQAVVENVEDDDVGGLYFALIIDNDRIGIDVKIDNLVIIANGIRNIVCGWCREEFRCKIKVFFVVPPKGHAVEYLIDCMIQENDKKFISNLNDEQEIAKLLAINPKENLKERYNSWNERMIENFYCKRTNKKISKSDYLKNMISNVRRDTYYINQVDKMKTWSVFKVCTYDALFKIPDLNV